MVSRPVIGVYLAGAMPSIHAGDTNLRLGFYMLSLEEYLLGDRLDGLTHPAMPWIVLQ